MLQFKTLVRPLDPDGWGWGVAAGTVRHPEITPGPNQLGNTYAYFPVSRSFADGQAVLHGNLGWLRDRASRRDNLTWGLGGEFQATAGTAVIAEGFGDHRSRPYWQLGVRQTLVPDRLQIDATAGQQVSGPRSGRWVSVGFRLTPDRLF